MRNNKIGIFQLNMEILKLRAIMEYSVDKIVNGKGISIIFKY